MSESSFFSLLLQEGEGYKVEFKEKIAHLDSEMVAMANSAGGSIFLGIDDNNHVKGVDITNALKSQVLDIARNCDPSIPAELISHQEMHVLEVRIPEGEDKPYRCREGFFLRIGPTSQKLKRDEIVKLIQDSPKIQFDEAINISFYYPEDFSVEAFQLFLKQCGIVTSLPNDQILLNLNVAREEKGQLLFTNAGVLFFAKNPQKFFPEAFITAVKYAGLDRFSILDNQNITGNLIEQIEKTMQFILRHVSVSVEFSSETVSRFDRYDYPPLALREAIVNALAHRDYLYESSHIYIHLYADRIDIENPGGLYHGLTLENLGKRSVRRNRLIADLLHRARYIERVGSGIDRMRGALAENNNPPMEISATNFFDIRFYNRIREVNVENLSQRQIILFDFLKKYKLLTKKEAAAMLKVSEDTALRELKGLLQLGLIVLKGRGKATVYELKNTFL